MPFSSIPPTLPAPPAPPAPPALPVSSVTSATASTFPAAGGASGHPPDWQTYEAHIESWCDSTPPGEDRGRLKNQILAAFHSAECLDLRDRTDIISLPPGLWLAGGLDLRGCSGLEALPEGLHVGGHVNMTGCTNLAALPHTFHFGGAVTLRGCSALRELPVEWNVNGDLDISFCTRLSSLLIDWNIHGDLRAPNCTDLTDMQGRLLVDGGLNFSNCSKLAVFPGILKFNKWINLSFCEQVKILHPSIMIPRENRAPLVVYLGRSGLSRETLADLRQIAIPNVRFDTSILGEPVQSSSQTRNTFPLTRWPGPPTSYFDRMWAYASGPLLAMALEASWNAAASAPFSHPPLEPRPPESLPPYEALSTISIEELEKLGVDMEQPCPITLETPEHPVYVKPAVYDGKALREHFERRGKNPLTRHPIDPNEVKRVVTQDALSAQSARQAEPLAPIKPD